MDTRMSDTSTTVVHSSPRTILHGLAVLLLLLWAGATNAAGAPYPQSSVISGITWDFSTLRSAASGSDEWPVTWADDDNIYTSWGDGGGFSGNNTDGRVSIGVARVEGTPPNWQGYDIFGGLTTEAPSTFVGKANSIISIGGVLYMYVTEQDAWMRAKIGRSVDHGQTWIFNGGSFDQSGWDFAQPNGAFSAPTVIQFGRDYAGARDGYVYLYSEAERGLTLSPLNQDLLLARVPKDQVQSRAAYEFYTGTDGSGNPVWSADITQAKSVFHDSNGVNWGAQAAYDPGLKRYLLTTRRSDANGGMDGAWGVFDAPEPWGPWTTVAYYANWDQGTPISGATSQITYSFPTKWMSTDGKTLWLIASIGDSFNVLKGVVTLNSSADTVPPSHPTGLTAN